MKDHARRLLVCAVCAAVGARETILAGGSAFLRAAFPFWGPCRLVRK